MVREYRYLYTKTLPANINDYRKEPLLAKNLEGLPISDVPPFTGNIGTLRAELITEIAKRKHLEAQLLQL